MHRAQTLALLLAGLLCSGCASGAISSNYRPVEDLMLIQTIGVDRAAEGVCLSASTGRAGKNEPPQRMTQTGETVLAALDRLQDRTPNAELFYAQTSYLLLGEEAAAAGELAPLLDFIARNPDMRLSAPLFLVRGATAQQTVMDTGDDRTDVTEALTALQKDTALSGAGPCVFLRGHRPRARGQRLRRRGRRGVRAHAGERGRQARARPGGVCDLSRRGLSRLHRAETARGASMLLGVVTNGDIAVRDGDGSTVMLTLDTCRAAIRPVWDGGTLARVDVTLQLHAGISELRTPRRITAQAYQDELNAALAACVGGWVRDALAASQALEADFLGVGQAVAVRSGRRWAAIRDDWAELWPDVPVRVTVDADVGRTYDLRDGIDTTGGGR